MDNRELAENLKKLAEQIRERAEKSEEEKTAEQDNNKPTMLDPQRVLDFMLFYGR
ncbi:hypothetical protein [Desulfovibrio sp. An276]|uniref:hypothetical protein n=1 Tax=Desulfovibrio sp. An276 TaxID=1965618 RepID=UPI0013A5FD23|nr:hypothetical protein [Desulfovibrio sp. An276]